MLREENGRKGKECLRTRNIRTCYLLTLPLLVFSLIVTRPTTESLDSDTRLFATSCYRVACTGVFPFLHVLLIYIITGFTAVINDVIFTKPVLISFDIIVSLCSSYLPCPSLIAN